MGTIKISNACKKYGDTIALDDISLTIEENKIYGLLGRNGAGKTTLLNVINNRIFLDEGLIFIDNKSFSEDINALGKIYFMTEQNLYPQSMKIKELFNWTKEFYPNFDMSYALELSKKFELNINKKIKELSTGYSSICKLINTMASGAEILIFDEPVLGLDANHREMFYKELMESYKLAKYNVKSNLKPIIIFYLIFIAVITALGMVGGDTTGLEFSSVIFLFVIGLNSFKENFYFSQANNISREDFFKSMAVTILPVALGMSIIDLVINRTYNLFVASPTIYDMAYGSRPYFLINVETWTQSNSIQTLFGTVTFLFASYIVVFAIGLLITIIYYKCNKTMKILVTLSPLFFQAILGIIVYFSPQFEGKLEVFIEDILGINTRNSYMAVMTFICLFIILMFFVYILVRKAVVKRV